MQLSPQSLRNYYRTVSEGSPRHRATAFGIYGPLSLTERSLSSPTSGTLPPVVRFVHFPPRLRQGRYPAHLARSFLGGVEKTTRGGQTGPAWDSQEVLQDILTLTHEGS